MVGFLLLGIDHVGQMTSASKAHVSFLSLFLILLLPDSSDVGCNLSSAVAHLQLVVNDRQKDLLWLPSSEQLLEIA